MFHSESRDQNKVSFFGSLLPPTPASASLGTQNCPSGRSGGPQPVRFLRGSALGKRPNMTTASSHRPPPLARTNSKPLSEIIGAEPSIESWLHDEGKEGQEVLHVPSVLERHLKRRPSTEVVIERGILMPINPEAHQSLSFANDPDGQKALSLSGVILTRSTA